MSERYWVCWWDVSTTGVVVSIGPYFSAFAAAVVAAEMGGWVEAE